MSLWQRNTRLWADAGGGSLNKILTTLGEHNWFVSQVGWLRACPVELQACPPDVPRYGPEADLFHSPNTKGHMLILAQRHWSREEVESWEAGQHALHDIKLMVQYDQ